MVSPKPRVGPTTLQWHGFWSVPHWKQTQGIGIGSPQAAMVEVESYLSEPKRLWKGEEGIGKRLNSQNLSNGEQREIEELEKKSR
jgi:hypothetical protein